MNISKDIPASRARSSSVNLSLSIATHRQSNITSLNNISTNWRLLNKRYLHHALVFLQSICSSQPLQIHQQPSLQHKFLIREYCCLIEYFLFTFVSLALFISCRNCYFCCFNYMKIWITAIYLQINKRNIIIIQ